VSASFAGGRWTPAPLDVAPTIFRVALVEAAGFEPEGSGSTTDGGARRYTAKL